MSHNTTFLLIIIFKVLATISAIAGAVYLASNDKSGWGWLIFLAVLISPGNINLDNDPQTKEHKVESN